MLLSSDINVDDLDVFSKIDSCVEKVLKEIVNQDVDEIIFVCNDVVKSFFVDSIESLNEENFEDFEFQFIIDCEGL